MKEIKSINGKETILVDDDLFDYLNQFRWCASMGYATRTKTDMYGKRKTVSMHMEIMATPKGMFTDHINHNGLDNRRENLRIVTRQENCKNKSSSFKGHFTGVSRKGKQWVARITFNKKQICLGLFDKKQDAINARIEANKKYGYHENHGKWIE